MNDENIRLKNEAIDNYWEQKKLEEKIEEQEKIIETGNEQYNQLEKEWKEQKVRIADLEEDLKSYNTETQERLNEENIRLRRELVFIQQRLPEPQPEFFERFDASLCLHPKEEIDLMFCENCKQGTMQT